MHEQIVKQPDSVMILGCKTLNVVGDLCDYWEYKCQKILRKCMYFAVCSKFKSNVWMHKYTLWDKTK